ncbi:carboxypeptidase-like regulatory domain-containing protein [Leptolyngbyaceae cyanobacterium UHCC 1019]
MLSLNQAAIALGAIALTFSSTYTQAKPMKPCTPSFEPGITATVADAKTKTALEAQIVIQESTFQETLRVQGATASGQTIYGGAFERPGRYTVTASAPGYRSTVLKDVQVSKAECHVATRRLDIKLKRAVSQ